MNETRAYAQTAQVGANANGASASVGAGATAATARVEVQAAKVLATILLVAAAEAATRRQRPRRQVIRLQGIPSAEAFGVPTLSVSGQAGALTPAVEPSPEVRALIARVDALVSSIDVQRRRETFWMVLAVLIALASFAGDRWDALNDDAPAPPPPVVAPPAVPQQGGPVVRPAVDT